MKSFEILLLSLCSAALTVQKQIKELVGTDIDLEVDSVTKRT
ncbi:hypothetical protein [Paenibacillus sp. MER TA 81-3]|nr:hypothetical protein [Paenibacillus sp. MER TA 81-3]